MTLSQEEALLIQLLSNPQDDFFTLPLLSNPYVGIGDNVGSYFVEHGLKPMIQTIGEAEAIERAATQTITNDETKRQRQAVCQTVLELQLFSAELRVQFKELHRLAAKDPCTKQDLPEIISEEKKASYLEQRAVVELCLRYFTLEQEPKENIQDRLKRIKTELEKIFLYYPGQAIKKQD